MEVRPDFDVREVARTVAQAVSNLHNRNLSDSFTDETPLVVSGSDRMHASRNNTTEDDDTYLISGKETYWDRVTNFIPARYVLTILGFLGFCNVYALRVNLSVALVAMVNSSAVYTNESRSDECSVIDSVNSSKIKKDGEFVWTPSTQGTILASFFYGYILTQIPGGRMAELFGGKWLYGFGVLCTSIFTLLTPIAARWNVTALIILRILEGFGEGVTFPAMHAMLGRWLPKYERSLLSTIIYSGAQIGTVIAMPISGILCDSDFLGGWPSVFYVFGFLGCIWFVFWAWLIHETPTDHPRISKAELMYIQRNQGDELAQKNLPIPWHSILTSVPVWALVITHFGQNWGFYTLLTELPTYLSAILHFNIKNNGFLSALPYLLQAIVSWVSSYIADIVRQKEYLSISAIRKICNTVGFFGPALCLLGVALAGCKHALSVFFLTLAMGFNGFIYSGYMVTHVDMSPDYAGTLMGMTNCFATLAGLLAPEVVGALTENNQTLHQWQIIFYISMAVYVATGILFIICGSARLQKWGLASLMDKDIKEKDSDSEDAKDTFEK